MIRKIVIRFVALGAGLAVGIVLAELALRVTGSAPTDGLMSVTVREFKAIPGIFSPGQSLMDLRNPKLPHHVSTNSLGYRGAEFSRLKAPGERRILFIGDSFVYGDFVNDEETLPAQLEQHLRLRCSAVRVVNSGLGDATIVDEINLLARGLELSPDLVILLFSENDVVDLARTTTWERLADNRAAKSRFPLGIVYPVLRRTALWNFALSVRATIRTRANETPEKGDWIRAAQNTADSATLSMRSTYTASLTALRDTLAGRGVPLLFVVYPSHWAVSNAALRTQLDWVTMTAAEARVPTVSLLAPLLASRLPKDSLYLLPHDGHPSPRGYSIAASHLADTLTATDPIRKSCR